MNRKVYEVTHECDCGNKKIEYHKKPIMENKVYLCLKCQGKIMMISINPEQIELTDTEILKKT